MSAVKNCNPSSISYEPLGHVQSGTVYGLDAVKAYSHDRGFELYHFLDRHIFAVLLNLSGKKVLDLGCGAAPHAIYAAEHGAIVDGFDTQPQMIEEARKAIAKARIIGKINVSTFEETLPNKEPTYDHALSINVGCNLPNKVFKQHFTEIGRTLKALGTATVSAPNSLRTVFTDGTISDDANKQINQELSTLPDNPSPAEIKDHLITLKSVLSATFTVDNSRLILVTPSTNLEPGQIIWRKLPSCVIPNYYHSDSEYREAIVEAGLKITKIQQNVLELDRENLGGSHLGAEYSEHPPFIVYHLQKDEPRTEPVIDFPHLDRSDLT